jgi:hypothetical protein
MKECRLTTQAFFEKNKDAFVTGEAPEVKVRLWMVEQKVYVCSTRGEEKVMENQSCLAVQ